MKCYLCDTDVKKPFMTCGADKYQELIGITRDKRRWYKCPECGLIFQKNCLVKEELQQIYLKYRDVEIRKESVGETFKKMNRLPYEESENMQRVDWLEYGLGGVSPRTFIDIGSGLGVFPHELKKCFSGSQAFCIEPEPDSAKFIDTALKMVCHQGFYEKGLTTKADLVTLVHVLEHFVDPLQVLKDINEADLKSEGNLFIEIPNPREFDYLPKDHDEFNSTHLWFFPIPALVKMLAKAGFEPFKVSTIHYKDRNLTRTRVLC